MARVHSNILVGAEMTMENKNRPGKQSNTHTHTSPIFIKYGQSYVILIFRVTCKIIIHN